VGSFSIKSASIARNQRADGGQPIFRGRPLHRVKQRSQELRRHGADQKIAVLAPEGVQHRAANLLRTDGQ
jgi:hypothetical protein